MKTRLLRGQRDESKISYPVSYGVEGRLTGLSLGYHRGTSMKNIYKTASLFSMYAGLGFFALAAGVLHAADAQAKSDELIAKSYEIKDVREVVADGGVKLKITQGSTESLRVQAEASLMDQVSVDLTGQRLTLHIKNKPARVFDFLRWIDSRDDEITFILQVKTLNHIETSGAVETTLGDFDSEMLKISLSGASDLTTKKINVGNLSLTLSGASEFDVDELIANTISADVSGSSNFEVNDSGESQSAQIRASGASEFQGKSLKVTTADVEASGASNIEIHAVDVLSGGASGASNIHYIGQPRSTLTATGAAEINAIR
ncbi:MAG: DUF2807 domain-containing protein [Moraxellaceae bacterium]|nr:MAG: DUF2807 domain-containing protein [Moraxellaceae bacterium]